MLALSGSWPKRGAQPTFANSSSFSGLTPLVDSGVTFAGEGSGALRGAVGIS
jgi:hypothetical protein